MGLASALCACSATAHERYERPPPPREETIEAKPGYFWVHGRWERSGGTWTWRGGHLEAERPGFEYVEGRWEPRGDYYIWVEESWRPIARGSAARP